MLILDFDGVLINSIDEVTLTVYNAATGKLVTTLAALPKVSTQPFSCPAHWRCNFVDELVSG
jgi:hypothetical protein